MLCLLADLQVKDISERPHVYIFSPEVRHLQVLSVSLSSVKIDHVVENVQSNTSYDDCPSGCLSLALTFSEKIVIT